MPASNSRPSTGVIKLSSKLGGYNYCSMGALSDATDLKSQVYLCTSSTYTT